MRSRISFLVPLLLIGISGQALAFSPPNLSDLDSNQVDAVFKDFGANFAFRPLEPASTYGDYFGLSFGIIGNLTDSSDIRSNIPDTSGLAYLPDADIFLGVQAPFGLAAEFGFFPSISVGGFKIHSVGGDLKWTLNSIGKMKETLPVDVALRVMYSSSGLSYSQTVSGVQDTVSYTASSFGTNLSVSKDFAILEPYVGLGYIHTGNTLSDTGAITLFQSTVSLSDSFSDSNSGVWFYGGFQITLLIPTISAEYDSMYGVSSGSVKIGFKI